MDSFDRLCWHLLVSSRGGETRRRLIGALLCAPQNTHQLAKELELDYKTVEYHVTLLLKHNVLSSQGGYGATLFVTDQLKQSSVMQHIQD